MAEPCGECVPNGWVVVNPARYAELVRAERLLGELGPQCSANVGGDPAGGCDGSAVVGSDLCERHLWAAEACERPYSSYADPAVRGAIRSLWGDRDGA